LKTIIADLKSSGKIDVSGIDLAVSLKHKTRSHHPLPHPPPIIG
jgi:hypothetical protein